MSDDSWLRQLRVAGSVASVVADSVSEDGLRNPSHTFDHVMVTSGQRVKGFAGERNEHTVVIFIAKEAHGKNNAGDLVTPLIPSPTKAANWGIP